LHHCLRFFKPTLALSQLPSRNLLSTKSQERELNPRNWVMNPTGKTPSILREKSVGRKIGSGREDLVSSALHAPWQSRAAGLSHAPISEWLWWRELNSQPPVYETGALNPVELHHIKAEFRSQKSGARRKENQKRVAADYSGFWILTPDSCRYWLWRSDSNRDGPD
jgi:hypothetical protein